MQIEFHQNQDTLSIQLAGELDHHAAGQLFSSFSALPGAVPRRCALELSGLSFMDSSGIAVVLGLHRRLGAIGSELVVRGAPPQAMRVFHAAGVDKLIKFDV